MGIPDTTTRSPRTNVSGKWFEVLSEAVLQRGIATVHQCYGEAVLNRGCASLRQRYSEGVL